MPPLALLASITLSALASQLQEARPDPRPGVRFVDISDASGIRDENFAEEPPEGMQINDHSRLAFADLNGDGLDDVVMHSLYPNAGRGVPFEHLVFLNRGEGRFENHSDASGLRCVQAGFFAFADVDNDGDQDLFAGLDLPEYGEHTSTIWMNDGAGRFTRRKDAGVERASPTLASCATFGDFDGDGKVDLFVGNGSTFAAAEDLLYRGVGDGTFTDASGALEGNPARPSNGVVTADWDDDGDLDLFVSTYGVSRALGHNHLWRNDGQGNFREVGVEVGFAVQAAGNSWLEATEHGRAAEPGRALAGCVGSNGFGLDCGDVDNDGDVDVLLTAISHPNADVYTRKWSDPTQLLMNSGAEGGHRLTDRWSERGLPFNEGDVDGALVDLDNDGRLDISLSRDRKYEPAYEAYDQKAWFGLYRQRSDGSFESVGEDSGINDPREVLRRMKSAQNHAWSDIDGDGDLDLLVGGRDQGGGRPNFLFRNESSPEHHWLAVRVVGDGEEVDRDAFGARVRVRTSGGLEQTREKKSARGMYNSEDTRRLHFGLAREGAPVVLAVRWLDGREHRFTGVEVDRTVTITYPDTLR